MEQREALDPRGLAQSQLVNAHLTPHLGLIQADLEALRVEADVDLEPRLGNAPGSDPHGGYPLGFCKQIRDFCWNRIRKPDPTDLDRPAFKALRQFQAAGGVIKGIWGIQKDKYFQNALQVGDLWFDLANDTVDADRNPVEILPIAEAQFTEITSFEQYARVAETYWGVIATPNLYLPTLAVTFPVLFHTKGQKPRIAAPVTLTPRNIREGYRPAELFFRDSAFAARRLPDAMSARLAHKSGQLGEPMTRRQLEDALAAERHALNTLSESAFADRFATHVRAANTFMTGG